jgi:PAS domain S-box-containing protein
MPTSTPFPSRDLDEDVALRTILEGTATETGERFFAALVENLAKLLKTHGAWVTEYDPEKRRLRALAFWMGGQWVQNYEIAIDGTPCEAVVTGVRLVHIPDNLFALYQGDPDIQNTGAVSYMGVPLLDLDGRVLGHLAVLDTRPMPEEPRVHALFRIFAARAAAELQRLRAERDLREREEKLSRLVDSAMDAILELDERLRVTRVNTAVEKVFRCPAQEVVGQDFTRLLTAEGSAKLAELIEELDARPEGQRYLWIPGGLTVVRPDGQNFPAEATLARFEMHRHPFYTVILRNVNERLEAEQKIRSLTNAAEYLQEEIRALHNFDEILGQSEPIRRVMRDIAQVAETDATVLISGETGTGKELIARAIHAASPRRDHPLVTVNCAAIPATLIESEFFGHEKGAFTGATAKREGRFALADGGTIFLDEIGELPLDLQAKLLRVLQEGEFEPVGSSRTRKVDVRVVAATNRDLHQATQEGTFREDLYYRLNVFPIHVPPLRKRGQDIILLASSFVAQFAQKLGRRIEPLSQDCARRLKGYSWPGNVRELQNVIERAVITSRDGRLNLDHALPEMTHGAPAESASTEEEPSGRIHTRRELEAIERTNLIKALEATGWRVAGAKGAARLLGMNPSTLSSRMKALRIKRPS